MHARALQRRFAAISALCDIPFDVAILPANLIRYSELIAAGVDHIGFGLDAASQRIFERVKTGNWERSLTMILQTAQPIPAGPPCISSSGLGRRSVRWSR